MSRPNHKQKPDVKQYQLSSTEISELSFVVSNLKTFQEIVQYWQIRQNELAQQVESRFGLNETMEVDWSEVFSTGKVLARKKDVKPELQPKRSQGEADPARR